MAMMGGRGKRFAFAMLLALAGCSADNTPDRVVEPRSFTGYAPRGTAPMRQAMIAGHAAARRQAGVAPLRWDDALARDARDYARTLSRTGRFEHAHDIQGAQGENLWTGTRGAYRYSEMIGHWVAERRYFRRGITPDFSTTGNWRDVSHYTQIVWRGTTRFGCGFASSQSDDYLVCRYTPPGNVVGQDVFGG